MSVREKPETSQIPPDINLQKTVDTQAQEPKSSENTSTTVPSSKTRAHASGASSESRTSSVDSIYFKNLIFFIFSSLIVLVPSVYLAANDLRAPDLFREYGVVGNITKALDAQKSSSLLSIPLSVLLRGSLRLNFESQNQAASFGALQSANTLISDPKNSAKQLEGLNLLQELVRENPTVKESALKEGLLDAITAILKEDNSEKVSAKAAEVVAHFAADSSSNRKKRASSTGLVDELLRFVEGGQNRRSSTSINSIWAFSNLLADAPAIQAIALELGFPQILSKLIQKDIQEKIVQPAIFSAGNLAAKYKAGQEALREAGVLRVLVSIIESEVAWVKDIASEPFHTEVLEHISELQRNDPAVRDALSEVGGLEELLGIIESGAKLKASSNAQGKQLAVIEGKEDEEDELSSIRVLMRDLQDEVDTESGILPDVKLPVLSRAPTGAKILKKLVAKTRQQIAGDAAWALSLLVSDNTENQNKARDEGALEALVKLLEGAEDATVAKHALTAISSLVKNNLENKSVVREANGVQGLVKLLASNPADKDVLKATAQALKFMSSDRPVYETVSRGGLRWLRILGRHIATFATSIFGAPVSPEAGFAIAISISVTGIAMIFVVILEGFLTKTNLGASVGTRLGTNWA